MKKKNVVETVLNEMNVFSQEDYDKLSVKWNNDDYRLNQGGQAQIDALRDAVVDYYEGYQYNQLNGQFISIKPESVDEQLSNYMCLFPHRALIETAQMTSFFDKHAPDPNGFSNSYDLPPSDFIRKYYRYKKLIDREIAYLYPIGNAERDRLENAIIHSGVIIPIKNIAEVSRKGSIQTLVQQSDKFYMAFPWLYNARLDDFIEICDRYPEEFKCLSLAIEKLAESSNGNGDLQENTLKELKEALVNIQISYEKRMAELKVKGITAVVGIMLTCIPFAVKDYFTNFDPSLWQTIVGGASLVGSKDILNNFFSLKNEEIKNPYWVVWKWKNTVPDVNNWYTYSN